MIFRFTGFTVRSGTNPKGTSNTKVDAIGRHHSGFLNRSVQCKEAREQLLLDALHDHLEGLTRMDVKAVFEPDGQVKRIEKIIFDYRQKGWDP